MVFQSTRPRGARRFLQMACNLIFGFNPRAHAGRDQDCSGYVVAPSFNPRAHAGRDLLVAASLLMDFGFNPRAHAGRDSVDPFFAQPTVVSIHAPTRGATTETASAGDQPLGFTPRAHAGRDLFLCFFRHRSRFQSTRPRGARQDWRGVSEEHSCFNPRAHAGRDYQSDYFNCWLSKVSIHAPTRGATQIEKTKAETRKFQSTRPRGARLRTIALMPICTSFNPRAHAGRDKPSLVLSAKSPCFNPRAHAGRDCKCFYYLIVRDLLPAIREPEKEPFSLITFDEGMSYKSLIINRRENTLFFAMLCIRNIRLSILRKHRRMSFCRYSPLDCSNCFQENRNECYLSRCQSWN